MAEPEFHVLSAEAVSDSAIALVLEISNRPVEERVESIALRCQIQIEAPRRRYNEQEKRRLLDLFGEPERWGQTLRSMLWANVGTTVPGFTGATTIVLKVPCSLDFNEGVTKYFEALEGGDVPITLLFTGTVFYNSAEGRLQAAPISWNSEARFRLPVRIWRGQWIAN